MKKYFAYSIDTRLRPALELKTREELLNFSHDIAQVLLEVNRLEGNRVQRIKNLTQRARSTRVLNLTTNKLKELCGL